MESEVVFWESKFVSQTQYRLVFVVQTLIMWNYNFVDYNGVIKVDRKG